MMDLAPLMLTLMMLTPPDASPRTAPDGAGVVEPTPPASLPRDAIVYHTLSAREAQVTFTSAAPLERIVGKTNAVVGYVVQGPKEQPARLVAADWVLPIRTLATGLPLRDEHMVGRDWLDADAFPTIEFSLTDVEAIKPIKQGDGFSTWSATLVGRMTLHGVTRDMRVDDARLSFLAETDRTREIAPGNLLFLKCDYVIRLSDFGIRHADVPDKVSDTVELTQLLRMSDASPEALRDAQKAGATKAETPNSP